MIPGVKVVDDHLLFVDDNLNFCFARMWEAWALKEMLDHAFFRPRVW